MGRHSSDEERRRSRRDETRRRRSRTRSGSRRRRRSRSRERRRRRSRDRISKYRGRHRSSSKSRRGRYNRSASHSRSRSQRRESRSSSYNRDRRRKRDRSRSSSSSSSSSSRLSNREKASGVKDRGKDSTGVKDSYIPSADALAKIESAGFSQEAFVSQNSNKSENGVSMNSNERSHEDAIFGINGSSVSKNNITSIVSTHLHVQSSEKKTGVVMASLLHEREEVKNDRWMKKLQLMRERKLKKS